MDSISMRRVVLVAALLALSAGPFGKLAAQEKVAFSAGHILISGDEVRENAMLLVVDGRVEKVAMTASGKAPKGYRQVDLGKDAWIAAGMFDLGAKITAPGDLAEGDLAADLGMMSADVLVAGHRDLGLMRAAGITSCLVLPDPKAPIAGWGAVLEATDEISLIARRGPLALALTESVESNRRYPTSFMGAINFLGDQLAKPADANVKAVVDGKHASICLATTEMQLRGLLKLAKALSFKCGVITDGSLRKVLPEAKGLALDVALTAPGFATSRRDLLLPALAAKQGHRVAFHASAPKNSPATLRHGAALAVRHGLSRAAAWNAITSVPAAMAGVGDKVGALKPGMHADFIVLDGHPLDLASRLHQTFIGGRSVHEATMPKEKTE